ncbi:hypothetical protein Tco_1422719 [Tanacetum coccineum]
MGRDTIQLEDAVLTIFGEYILEFTSEYGIPEGLHPELPGPEETIVDFPEGKVSVYTKFLNLQTIASPFLQFLFDILGYYQIHLSQLSVIGAAKVKTKIRPHAAHEVPLLTVTASRVIEMEETGVASESSGIPSALEKSPLDFADEDPPQTIAEMVGTEGQVQDELSGGRGGHHGPPVIKRQKQMRHKRVNDEAEANAPPKVLRKDHVSSPAKNDYGEKSLTVMGLGAGSISSTPSTQGAPTTTKSVSDPDPLSYAKPQPYPEQGIAQSSRGTATEIPTEHVATTKVNVQLSVGSPESRRSTSVPSVVGSPGVSINRGGA